MAVGLLSGGQEHHRQACLGGLGALTGTGRPSLPRSSQAPTPGHLPRAAPACLSLPTGARPGAQAPPQPRSQHRVPGEVQQASAD